MPDKPASDREYSISELEEASGTSRRTIHYYIGRDLLPPADGSGLAARYREMHVLRLRAIAALKEHRLKLEGVREVLDSMSVEELRETFEDVAPHPSKLAYRLQQRMADRTLLKLMEDAGEEGGPGMGIVGMTALARRLPPEEPSRASQEKAAGEPDSEGAPGARGPAAPQGTQYGTQRVQASLDDATTWRRMQVTPDLEIHYRPGRDSRFTSKLREVVRLIRTLFGTEDPPPGGPK